MDIGIMAGCFNPVTVAHIEVANAAAEKYKLNKVIFEATGSGYWKPGLIHARHRQDMLLLATKDNHRLSVGYFDSAWPRHVKFFETLSYYYGLFRDATNDRFEAWPSFKLIIGSDNLYNLEKYYPDPEQKIADLLGAYWIKFIVVTRNGDDVHEIVYKCPHLKEYAGKFMSLPLSNPTSSTMVREAVKSHKPYEHLVCPAVYSYIEANNLYREVIS